ncbi:MAG: hypothetical protein WDN75_12540 [Bacteroidota bacterium]
MKRPYFLFTLLVVLASCRGDNDPVPSTGTQLKSRTSFLLNSKNEFRPAEKVEYFYSPQGKLVREEQSQYDIFTKQFYDFSVTKYSYEQNRLITIEKSINSTPHRTITYYEYAGDRISRIKVDNDIDTQADIHYLEDNRVEIVYTNSNGTSFIYRFTIKENNISLEQTFTTDERVSSEVTHEFDNRKNPFTLLGYTDLFFSNFSANNKIKTDSQYFSEAFPQSVPVSYEYQYNEMNYPTEQITVYKSTGTSGITSKAKTIFEYQ